MSLEIFQQTWLEIVLQPEIRAAWQRGAGRQRDLSTAEQADLQTLVQSPEYIEQVQAQVQNLLIEALPLRVRFLLGEHSQAFMYDFVRHHPPPALFPRAERLRVLLTGLRRYLERHHLIIPYLRDVISYELALSKLRFFELPSTELVHKSGPRLAAWAKIIMLNSQFPVVLDHLKQGQVPHGVSEHERQAFLLMRYFEDLHLEALDEPVAACLGQCQGEHSWAEIVNHYLVQLPDPTRQKSLRQSLLQLESHYLRRQIIS